jgi:hypothetical protein
MSTSTVVKTFSPKDEQPIPFWPLSSPPPSQEDRLYVIDMEASNGRLRYFFSEQPAQPDPTGDGPLQIRILQDCTVILRLSANWNWEFRHDNAVVLGPMDYTEKPRYFNLQPTIVNGQCLEVRFNALYLTDTDSNHDPYAIYVNIYNDEGLADGPVALLVRIDPDMTNPGGLPV